MKLSREAIQRMVGGKAGNTIIGGGGGDSSSANYATQSWVNENYLSIEFFRSLFKAYDNSDPAVEIVPNGGTVANIDNIKAMFGFWTEQYVSALGQNSAGSGGGGATLNEPLASINAAGLSAHPSTSGQTVVWNGTAWVYGNAGGGSGAGTVTSVGMSVPTGFTVSGSPVTSSGTLTLRFASGYSLPTTAKQTNWDAAYGWGNHATAGYATEDWVAEQGYVTQAWVQSQGFATKTWVQQQGYLTEHQRVSGTFWGQSWSNGGTVTGAMTGVTSINALMYFSPGKVGIGTSNPLTALHLANGYNLTVESNIYLKRYLFMNYDGEGIYLFNNVIHVHNNHQHVTNGVAFSQAGATTFFHEMTVNGLITAAANIKTASYIEIGDIRLVYDSGNNALKVVNKDGSSAANFYATGSVSALGMSGQGSSGGVVLTEPLASINAAGLAAHPSRSGQTIVWNGTSWEYGTAGGGAGTVTSVAMTVPTGFSVSGSPITSSGTLALSFAAGYSLPANTKQAHWDAAYGWGNHAAAGYATQTWVQEQGYLTSASMANYATKTWVQQQGYLTSVSWAGITGKPSTLAGYGITDAKIQNGTIYLGTNSIKPLTQHQSLAGYATQDWVQSQGYLVEVRFSDLISHPTTLAGYGITDAINKNTTFWGQTVSGGTVSGSISAGSNGGSINQFHAIELNSAGTLANLGGYIDFHFNGSNADYTARIIEDSTGVVSVLALNRLTGLRVGTGYDADYVQIGNIRLIYDDVNNALKVERANGTAANFYATGGVSALGMGVGSGVVDNMTFNTVTVNDTLTVGGTLTGGTSWNIAQTGYARFTRMYLDATRYIYIDSNHVLKYYNGTTSKTIVLQ